MKFSSFFFESYLLPFCIIFSLFIFLGIIGNVLILNNVSQTVQCPEFSVNLPTMGSALINSSFFKKFDYSNAVVRFLPSYADILS